VPNTRRPHDQAQLTIIRLISTGTRHDHYSPINIYLKYQIKTLKIGNCRKEASVAVAENKDAPMPAADVGKTLETTLARASKI
jgi:hypothetical protein